MFEFIVSGVLIYTCPRVPNDAALHNCVRVDGFEFTESHGFLERLAMRLACRGYPVVFDYENPEWLDRYYGQRGPSDVPHHYRSTREC